MNKTGILSETQHGSRRINYTDEEGNYSNITQQVRKIPGRAIYQRGKFRVDSELQKRNTKNKIRIKFNPDEYFKLFEENVI